MGKALGIGTQLYDQPALALNLEMSVKILFKGMTDGLFTGVSLADFFNPATADRIHARKIINGIDQAERIAGYAKNFEACLSE
jgi:putative chitinase